MPVPRLRVMPRPARQNGSKARSASSGDMPMPASNVAIICPTDGATRIGYRFDDQGKKIRICRKCGGDL